MKRMSMNYLVVTLAFLALSARAQTQGAAVEANASQLQPVSEALQVQPVQTGTQVQVVVPAQVAPAPQVVKQPTTVVEANPLTESRADQLRRQRQDVEVETEQKIVEKLEQSRLEDERKRMDRLFGGKLEAQPAEVVAPVQAAPAVVTPPVEVKAEEKAVAAEKLESVKNEIIDAIKAEKEADKSATTIALPVPEPEKPKNQYYMSALLGAAEYNSVSNIEGRWAAGFGLGAILPNRLQVEGQFVYSNYLLSEDFWYPAIFRELEQYNIGANVKYGFFDGAIRPLIGAGVAYTHRLYTDRYAAYQYWNGTSYVQLPGDSQSRTNAFDMSALVGVDIAISKSVSIGLEYKYSFNLMSWSNNDFIQRFRPEGTTMLEDLSYQIISVNSTFRF